EALGLAGMDPLAPGHSHYNALVSTEHIDALSGAIALRAFPCDIAPDPSVAGRAWAGWRDFDVRVRTRTGGDVVELELTPQDGAPLPDYRPGQYVPLAFEVRAGQWLERHYSLVGAPLVGAAQVPQGHRSYRIAVKRGAQGEGLSRRLHDAVVGAPADAAPLRVRLQTPRGHFLLPSTARQPAVLMAAGIGITPFLSLL